MNRKYSLKKNHEIEKLIKIKKSVGNYYYAIYYRITNKIPKIGISVSKKVGNAVVRNYQKRVLKEIIRFNIDEFYGIKCLIVIKKASMSLTFEEKKKQLEYLIKKINKDKEKSNEN